MIYYKFDENGQITKFSDGTEDKDIKQTTDNKQASAVIDDIKTGDEVLDKKIKDKTATILDFQNYKNQTGIDLFEKIRQLDRDKGAFKSEAALQSSRDKINAQISDLNAIISMGEGKIYGGIMGGLMKKLDSITGGIISTSGSRESALKEEAFVRAARNVMNARSQGGVQDMKMTREALVKPFASSSAIKQNVVRLGSDARDILQNSINSFLSQGGNLHQDTQKFIESLYKRLEKVK